MAPRVLEQTDTLRLMNWHTQTYGACMTFSQASLITAPDLRDLELVIPSATERIQTYLRSYAHRAVPQAVSERLVEATAEIQEAVQVKLIYAYR